MTATERQARYDANHTRRFGLKLNTTTDADIIAWLERQESIQGTVKALVRIAIREEARDAEDKRIAATLRRILESGLPADTNVDTTARG